MVFLKKLLITFIMIAFFVPAFSQTKAPAFKPPSVMTFLGGYRNTDTVNKESVKLILSLPLQVTDLKKNQYKIESYQFLYRRKSVTMNPENGKANETYTISSDRFDTTPLPKIWIENVGENLKQHEQIYIFDILVNDGKGHRFLAPELKITVK